MTTCLFTLSLVASAIQAPAASGPAAHRPAISSQAKPATSGVSGEALLHKGAHGVVGGPAAKPSGVDGSKVRGHR
jgi:hypothetical protein